MLNLTSDDKTLIQYLLGELSPADRDGLEDRYFSDDALHDQLLAIEEELIDAYVRGQLSSQQRADFEQSFLDSPERREKLAFARALVHRVDSQRRQSRPGKFWTPFTELAVAASLVLAAGAFWMITHVPPRTASKQTESRPPDVLAFTLLPSTRGPGQENRIEIPPGRHTVRLHVSAEGKTYVEYRAILETPEGASIGNYRAHAMAIDVPSQDLAAGYYVLRFQGVDKTGAIEDIRSFTFRVVIF